MLHTRDFAWLTVAWALLSAHPAAGQAPAKPADAKAIAALIAQLGSADFQERQAATQSLEAIGQPALAALREAAYKHDDAEVRRRAKGLVEKIENSLEQLLEDYKAYGLPLPPKDAPLVQYGSAGREELGFLLKPATEDHWPEVLQGLALDFIRDEDSLIRTLEPEKAALAEIDAWAKRARSYLVPLTIQCQARGWGTPARRLLKHWPKDKHGRTRRVTLRHEAWDHWLDQLTRADTDWRTASRYLHLLFDAEPTLNTEPERLLLKSLDLALVPRKSRPGSVEALIDDLVDVPDTSMGFRFPADPRYLRLVALGFEAVPALIDHLDDDRLTRDGRWPVREVGFPRVRDQVSVLLGPLIADEMSESWEIPLQKARARAWWEKAKKRGEEAQVLANVLRKEAPNPSEQLLWVLVKKYPQHLPKVYRTVLDEHPQMRSMAAARALAWSDVPRAKKVELYVYASRHKNLKHRYDALNELVKLDHEKFIEVLVASLADLPRTPEGPYQHCLEVLMAEVVLQTDDARAWKALEGAARRVDVGLRMQLLDRLDDPRYSRRRREQRLALLGAFLGDAALRDLSADPKRYKDFPAGHDFPRLEVRNFAALEIGRLLKLERKPVPTWDDEQWSRFRDEVREALKR